MFKSCPVPIHFLLLLQIEVMFSPPKTMSEVLQETPSSIYSKHVTYLQDLTRFMGDT